MLLDNTLGGENMAYTFKCADMELECPFVVTGASQEEVKKHVEMHKMDSHSDLVANMSDEDKTAMDAKIDSVITQS